MNIDSVRKGKQIEIMVCDYSERCGGAKKPYGMVFDESNTGYIVQVLGNWKYHDGGWYNGKQRIMPGDRLLVRIEKISDSILYSTLIRLYQ